MTRRGLTRPSPGGLYGPVDGVLIDFEQSFDHRENILSGYPADCSDTPLASGLAVPGRGSSSKARPQGSRPWGSSWRPDSGRGLPLPDFGFQTRGRNGLRHGLGRQKFQQLPGVGEISRASGQGGGECCHLLHLGWYRPHLSESPGGHHADGARRLTRADEQRRGGNGDRKKSFHAARNPRRHRGLEILAQRRQILQGVLVVDLADRLIGQKGAVDRPASL